MGEIIEVTRKPWGARKGTQPDWSQPSDADVRGALAILAQEGGNAKVATRRCADELQVFVSERDIRKWRDETYAKVWVQVDGERQRELEQIAEAQARQNAIRASAVTAQAIDRVESLIEEADLPDATRALDSLTKAASGGADMLLKLSGRPVNGGNSGSVAEHLRVLQDMGVITVEGTADEMPAQVVAGDGDQE